MVVAVIGVDRLRPPARRDRRVPGGALLPLSRTVGELWANVGYGWHAVGGVRRRIRSVRGRAGRARVDHVLVAVVQHRAALPRRAAADSARGVVVRDAHLEPGVAARDRGAALGARAAVPAVVDGGRPARRGHRPRAAALAGAGHDRRGAQLVGRRRGRPSVRGGRRIRAQSWFRRSWLLLVVWIAVNIPRDPAARSASSIPAAALFAPLVYAQIRRGTPLRLLADPVLPSPSTRRHPGTAGVWARPMRRWADGRTCTPSSVRRSRGRWSTRILLAPLLVAGARRGIPSGVESGHPGAGARGARVRNGDRRHAPVAHHVGRSPLSPSGRAPASA